MTAVWQALVRNARRLAAVARRRRLEVLSDAELPEELELLADELEFAERLALLRAEVADWELAHPGHTAVIDTGRELTPAEEQADLDRLRALVEQRKTEQAQLMRSWGRLPEQTRTLLVAAGAAEAPGGDPRFDQGLQAEIVRRERELVVLRLRGLLRSPLVQGLLLRQPPSRVRCRPRRFGRSPRRAARVTPARPRPEPVAAGRR